MARPDAERQDDLVVVTPRLSAGELIKETLMKSILKAVLAMATLAVSAQAVAQITFYGREGFEGRSFTAENQISNFESSGFNDRASSVVVLRGRWEICEDAGFSGRCAVLRPGRYPSLAAMSLNKSVSSVRMVNRSARVDDNRYAPIPATPQVTFYEREGFAGRSFSAENQVGNFERQGFNDRASSIVVVRDFWEACEDAWFAGRCVILRPGRYPSLAAMGLSDSISSVRVVSSSERFDESRYAPLPSAVVASESQITFYEGEAFQGRNFTTRDQVDNFGRVGFNDRAASVVVIGEAREVCEDADFGGRCVVLRPGRYATLSEFGLSQSISSVRAVSGYRRAEENRYAPPVALYNYQRRDDERLYDARVTSVRAVVGTPEQRCWVEREQVVQDQGSANVPGAIAGAIIGGILGHQVGGGRGKDVATAGGAIAGAAIGANVGRDNNGQPVYTQNVQRCTTAPRQARADYWDVTYDFRGQEYRVQMTTPPGPTVTVNAQGEPRV